MSKKDQINLSKLPKHIAIIMDGNGRWAQKSGKLRVFGHKSGVKSVREVAEGCAELGVEHVTLYAFSTENWSRPKAEVNALMTLLVSTIRAEVKTLNDNNIRLQAIGNLDDLPKKCREELTAAMAATASNTRMNLILALSYSAKWEMINAVKSIANKVANGSINCDDINDQLISNHLTTKDYPDPELLIRTSGEQRISNFLLWQLAYAEFIFTPILWPDFRKEHLYDAICEFQLRKRRFGKTQEQIETTETNS